MTRFAQEKPAVVILRSGHHGGLGIARTLGRWGVPVYCMDRDIWETGWSSRYCHARFLFDFETDSPDRLLEIGRRIGGRPLLIPTTDDGAIWLADNAGAIENEFRFMQAGAILTRTLCDKATMQELAGEYGVPVVKSRVPRCREDLRQFASESSFPVMVKAIDVEGMRRLAGGTKFVVHTMHELLALYERAQDGGRPKFLVQEFIEGDDWMFDGYFDSDSRCRFGITGRKIRRFPSKTGVTSLGVCSVNSAIREITAAFMKAIGYRGIVDIGYRLDRRDGQYKILDVNPRIGCTFRLFCDAGGLDVARALYMDLTGQQISAEPAIEGRKWIVEDFDLLSSLRSVWDRSLSPTEWVHSLRGINETACFASDDPLPLLFAAVSDCVEFFKWLRRKAGVRTDYAVLRQPELSASERRR